MDSNIRTSLKFGIIFLLCVSLVFSETRDSLFTIPSQPSKPTTPFSPTPYDAPVEFDDETEDPNSIDGTFSDEFVRIVNAKGYRFREKANRLYQLIKAAFFQTSFYQFEHIKNSSILLTDYGKLQQANITSSINNNSFRFLNPLAHVTNPEIKQYSTEDSDGDGLSDFVEKKFNFLIDKADSDDDGLTDFEEFMTYGTNPLSESSGASINGSSVTDQEYISFLNANVVSIGV